MYICAYVFYIYINILQRQQTELRYCCVVLHYQRLMCQCLSIYVELGRLAEYTTQFLSFLVSLYKTLESGAFLTFAVGTP